MSGIILFLIPFIVFIIIMVVVIVSDMAEKNMINGYIEQRRVEIEEYWTEQYKDNSSYYELLEKLEKKK